jgi:hypothetical protein
LMLQVENMNFNFRARISGFLNVLQILKNYFEFQHSLEIGSGVCDLHLSGECVMPCQ